MDTRIVKSRRDTESFGPSMAQKNPTKGKSRRETESYDAAYVYDLERRSGADTLDRDIEMLHSALGAVGSGWQDKDSMERRGQELASIQDRLSARRKYLSVAQMFPEDFSITSDQSQSIQRISDLENDFRNLSDSLDSYKQAYGAFSSADEYNKAVEYSRLTAEDIPRLEKEIEEIDYSIKRIDPNATPEEIQENLEKAIEDRIWLKDPTFNPRKGSEYYEQRGKLEQKRKELVEAKRAAYRNAYASVMNNENYKEKSQYEKPKHMRTVQIGGDNICLLYTSPSPRDM